MSRNSSVIYILPFATIIVFLHANAFGISLVYESFSAENYALVGYRYKTISNIAFSRCAKACKSERSCISVNFGSSRELKGCCVLNSCGVEDENDKGKSLVFTPGCLYHQVRSTEAAVVQGGKYGKSCVYTKKTDKCGQIKSVGAPVEHKVIRVTQGVWMKDPLGEMGYDTIFVIKGYNLNQLEMYENMAKLKNGTVKKTVTLPYKFAGTGAAVYGRYLFYSRIKTSYLIKYDLLAGTAAAEIKWPSYIADNTYSYQWGGWSGADFAVDESGLWLLYGTKSHSSGLSAVKINATSNDISSSIALSTPQIMKKMGNAFIACGVIYTVKSYSSRETIINFAFDTKTGRQWNPNIPFTNAFLYNSMIDYNPKEKVLYSWDNQHLVTYNLSFE